MKLVWLVLFAVAGFGQTISGVSGTASVLHEDGSVTAAAERLALAAGDTVRVDAGSGASVRVGPDLVRVGWDSALRIEESRAGEFRARLRRGFVVAEIGSAGCDWVFDTVGGAIPIRSGGIFRIELDGTRNAARLSVNSGVAEVRGRHLRAGDRFDLTTQAMVHMQQAVTSVHQANSEAAARMVREATGEPMVAPPLPLPRTPVYIGLPHAGVVIPR